MVGSRPPPESDMVSASMRYESKTADILLGLPVKPSCVSMVCAAAVNNGRHSMVGSRPPPESDMVSASKRHESKTVDILLGLPVKPSCVSMLRAAAVNNGRHSMVGSRPPPESDMVSASKRHESKTVDILLGLPVKLSCVSIVHAAALNNPMVDSRPPPDMAVQGKVCQVVSVVLIIVLGFALYPACRLLWPLWRSRWFLLL